MAIKIELKKNEEKKNTFVDFSFTTFVWGAFVPMFRGDGKGFVKLLLIWLATSGILVLIDNFPYDSIDFDKIPTIKDFIISLLDVKYKYIFLSYYLIIFLLAIISFVVWFFIAKNYNRDYTNKLLNQGYMAAEDDDYALAILKKYGYLEYTNEELRDNNKMELYKNIIETVKKDEKKKLYIFITYIIVIILFNVVPAVIAYTRIGDITYLEFLQNLYK
ncbi:hypothetical protein [Fusobacterium hwasookii]|uniref:Uncharacterized protein n=1 Tax=Fusobacterium hwasookii ChDC F128 TaxID=1216362 RepID=A0ABP2R5G8_9FUSO|nr:hypothetical protein [Fusobacterium hwasookii]EJU08148.1 hypothetical protein B437_02486 [Fusobacterium hwasookii ChDC F128]QNE65935.1 hypothetical protein H5V36_08860 [Fusobacterium hwasookii]